MEKRTKRFMDFIDHTPNSFCCIKNLKQILESYGFTELYENEDWDNLKSDGKYFVIRNDSSLITFKMTSHNIKTGFNITAAHTDSPSFSIKPSPERYENGYLKLNIEGYGGMINYSWLDRPLSIAGRVITLNNQSYNKHIVNIDRDLLVIPSQAIHINREVNEKCSLNPSVDMLPIFSLDKDYTINDIVADFLKTKGEIFEKICDYDMFLYNRDKAKIVGVKDELLLAPRLDDLASLYPAIYSFLNSQNSNSINVFCAFNNEEIGSMTAQGADSTFLLDVLTKVSVSAQIDLLSALRNSFVVSADNAHAIHPNYPSKSDPTNKVYLNKGVVIKHHPNYTTDALTSSMFKGLCDEASVPYQDFACRSDMKCGATLGGINQRHLGVDSVDIGIPQLAMHSANELIGTKDVLFMYKALVEFYNTSFIREKNVIKIKK